MTRGPSSPPVPPGAAAPNGAFAERLQRKLSRLDSRCLALSGADDDALILWDLRSGSHLAELPTHAGRVLGLAADWEAGRALCGTSEGFLQSWDLHTCDASSEMTLGHDGSAICVAMDVQSNRVLSGGSDKVLRLWELDGLSCLLEMRGHADSILAIEVDWPGDTAVTISLDRTLLRWDIKAGCPDRLIESTVDLRCFAVGWSFNRILLGDNAGDLQVWDLKLGSPLRKLKAHRQAVRCVSADWPQSRALSGSWKGALVLWDLKAGEPLLELSGHSHTVSCIDVDWNLDVAITGSHSGTMGGGTLRVWNVRTGRCMSELRGHAGSLRCVSASWPVEDDLCQLEGFTATSFFRRRRGSRGGGAPLERAKPSLEAPQSDSSSEEQPPKAPQRSPRLPVALPEPTSMKALEDNPHPSQYRNTSDGSMRLRRWVCHQRPDLVVPVAESAVQGSFLGCVVWKSSAVLAEYLVQRLDDVFKGGEALLEIGCGCGLPGIAALSAVRPALSCVAFADVQATAPELACASAVRAASMNGLEGNVQLQSLELDWNKPCTTWGARGKFDVVIAADASDSNGKPTSLARLFDHCTPLTGAIVIDANPDSRVGIDAFREAMVGHHGFRHGAHPFRRNVADDPPVAGLSCGASTIIVDFYWR